MKRSPFAKPKPLTPRQRKKGLVLPLSNQEAQVLRAVLGRTNDSQQLDLIKRDRLSAYPAAIALLEAAQKTSFYTASIYDRLNRACERRELPR